MVRNAPPETDIRRMVGKRIREFRRDSKMTQQRLAEQAERSVDAISAIERGLALPNFETLQKLARVLEVPLGDFFGHGRDDDSPLRTALTTRLIVHARTLTDEDLAVAVEQVAVLANRPTSPKRRR